MGVIYKISSPHTEKVYIGQTINLKSRWQHHLWSADHAEAPLYRAMRKYGKDSFVCEIIEEIEDNLLNDREIYWIRQYNSYVPNGYNCTYGGDGHKVYNEQEIINYYVTYGNYNATHTAKFFNCHIVTVLNILKRNGIKVSSTTDHLKKPLIQLDLDGNYIKEYSCSSVAEEETGIARGSILGCAYGATFTAGGYIWIYKEKYSPNINYGYTNPQWRPVRCLETGLEFKNTCAAAEWVKNENCKWKGSVSGMASNISRAFKNNIKAYGYHWIKI